MNPTDVYWQAPKDYFPQNFLKPITNTLMSYVRSKEQTGPIILYFYPADFTPGCTAQACSYKCSSLSRKGLYTLRDISYSLNKPPIGRVVLYIEWYPQVSYLRGMKTSSNCL